MRTDYFSEEIISGWDESQDPMFAPEKVDPVVAFLGDQVAQAGPGLALEFGIGTGRIALPLAEALGSPVHGMDLSEAMLRRLRAKPGAENAPSVQGDFAQDRVPGTFALVYLIFNTIMNLTGQDDQVACFRNAADHLVPGGRFVVEVMLPELQRLPFGERFRPFTVTETQLGFDEYDVVTQALISHHVSFDGGRATRTDPPFRYVWPAELDLMAQLAGMRLRERYGDWQRAPFTNTSTTHVSVYEKTAV